MIVTKTPLRLAIGGGGTDLPYYYSKNKGFLITASIDKYIYITLHQRKFYQETLLKYSKIEQIKSIEEIKHTRIREALKLLNVKDPLEIISIADVPAKTGLGSSSSFLVGLLNALHAYKREFISVANLAEEACKIDIDILKEPIGKQDQYTAAYGGIMQMEINHKGKVMVSRLNISQDTIEELQRNLFLFYTGITRDASGILMDQKKNTALSPEKSMDGMDQIKKIGQNIKKALENNDLRRFGEWLNVHWETKKTFSNKITSPRIDKWYDTAIQNGAIGGKIMGAGGGGFFMFYCDKNHGEFRKAMTASGLKELEFQFDFDGSKILFNA